MGIAAVGAGVDVVRLVAADDLAEHVGGVGDRARTAVGDRDRGELARAAVGVGGVIGRLAGLGEGDLRLDRPVPPGEAVGGGRRVMPTAGL